ncbi:hypothetical protein BH11PAT1_BH11PAT1_2780 [soil metagenome]
MRQEYITLVKKYIGRKPDYKSKLKDIKNSLVSLGASTAEIDEGIRQFEIDQQRSLLPGVSPQVKPANQLPQVYQQSALQKSPSAWDKITHMHVATSAVGLGIVFLLIGIYFLTAINTNSTPNGKTLSTLAHDFTNQGSKLPGGIAPPVYANSQSVDAKQVFKYTPSSPISLAVSGDPKKEVFGFMPYWMLDAEDKISLNALTTIALFALDVDGKGNIVTTSSEGKPNPGWAMWNDPKLNDFINRVKKKRLNIQLTIKAFNNDDIEKLVTSDEAQKTFVANAIYLVNAKSLSGINLDFEYVGNPDTRITEGFTRLVTNLSTELQRQIPHSTLTIDTYINSAQIPRLFDVEVLANYVDAFIVMGYDIHTPLGSPGPISPMEGEMGILWFMESYLEKVQPEKLILAVPYYAYDWAVPNVGLSGVSTATTILPYAEIAELSLKQNILWDDSSQTPYYKYKNEADATVHEVHYENARSLGIKYDYVNRKNLRGIGIWALGYDGLNADFRSLILEKFAN